MIVAAKICGVNLHQANQTPKLIMTHGFQLSLLTECCVKKYSLTRKRPRPQNKRYHCHLYLRIIRILLIHNGTKKGTNHPIIINLPLVFILLIIFIIFSEIYIICDGSI